MSGHPERWFRKENLPKMTLVKEIQLIVGEIIVLYSIHMFCEDGKFISNTRHVIPVPGIRKGIREHITGRTVREAEKRAHYQSAIHISE